MVFGDRLYTVKYLDDLSILGRPLMGGGADKLSPRAGVPDRIEYLVVDKAKATPPLKSKR